jgi:hypothetical protein
MRVSVSEEEAGIWDIEIRMSMNGDQQEEQSAKAGLNHQRREVKGGAYRTLALACQLPVLVPQ